MATVYREGNLDLLSGKVAVMGWGSQAHAHALNLQDSGVQVEVVLTNLDAAGVVGCCANIVVLASTVAAAKREIRIFMSSPGNLERLPATPTYQTNLRVDLARLSDGA